MNIDKFITIMLHYQSKELDNVFAIFSKEPQAHYNVPSSTTLWFIGLKVWGAEFPKREYELSHRKQHTLIK